MEIIIVRYVNLNVIHTVKYMEEKANEVFEAQKQEQRVRRLEDFRTNPLYCEILCGILGVYGR